MKVKLIIFLHSFTLFQVTRSQFNYGSPLYNSSPKQNYKASPNTPIQSSQASIGSNKPNIWSSPLKCSPPTATAFFLPTPPISPKVTILNAKEMECTERSIIRSLDENIPPPKYPCPFCTGKIKMPPNIDIPPPPLSYSVLPGVIDRIPSITPLVENVVECNCSCRKTNIIEDITDTSSLLSNTFSYDKELLEGFLTSLGL